MSIRAEEAPYAQYQGTRGDFQHYLPRTPQLIRFNGRRKWRLASIVRGNQMSSTAKRTAIRDVRQTRRPLSQPITDVPSFVGTGRSPPTADVRAFRAECSARANRARAATELCAARFRPDDGEPV
jgi:hypothetical protein